MDSKIGSVNRRVDQFRNEMSAWIKQMGPSGVSKEFLELVQSIGEASSKAEEDRIILNETKNLKAVIGTPDSTKKMKELVVRLIYCEMLGSTVPWGYVHAINMTQDQRILNKRTGYLAASLMLEEDHELMILVINSIRKDLESTNYLEVCAGLTTATKMISKEFIPPLLPIVKNLLDHDKNNEVVRKKAVMCLHRFILKSEEIIPDLINDFRKVICDPGPSVMAAALNIFYDLIKNNVELFRDLTQSFVSILKQVTDFLLGSGFTYHSIPAPWVQIKILKILALLGQDNQASSNHMYEVIGDTIKKADPSITGVDSLSQLLVGAAVLYECVLTISIIYPNSNLLDIAAKSISGFISSTNHNLKYLGIKALSNIVTIDPSYATEHQLVVIDCLESTDETLKRKTLDLLVEMTSTDNVVVVCDKLVSHLKSTKDSYLKTDLDNYFLNSVSMSIPKVFINISRITSLAEKYAPSNEWFVTIMTRVLKLGGDHVRPQVAHNLIRLIGEGTGESEEQDNELRLHAVSAFLKIAQTPSNVPLPSTLLKVIAWVVGEYAPLLHETIDTEDVILVMHDLIQKVKQQDQSIFSSEIEGNSFSSSDLDQKNTICWIVSGMMKLVTYLGGYCPSVAKNILINGLKSRDVDLQQRSIEFLELLKNQQTMEEALPFDSSAEELMEEGQETLPGLANFVKEQLIAGKAPYKTVTQRYKEESVEQNGKRPRKHSLAFEYPAPIATPLNTPQATASGSLYDGESGATNHETEANTIDTLKSAAEKVGAWTKDGYKTNVNVPNPVLPESQDSDYVPQETQPEEKIEDNLVQEFTPVSLPKIEPKRIQKTQRELDAERLFSGPAKKSGNPKMRPKMRPKSAAKKGVTKKSPSIYENTQKNNNSSSSSSGNDLLLDFSMDDSSPPKSGQVDSIFDSPAQQSSQNSDVPQGESLVPDSSSQSIFDQISNSTSNSVLNSSSNSGSIYDTPSNPIVSGGPKPAGFLSQINSNDDFSISNLTSNLTLNQFLNNNQNFKISNNGKNVVKSSDDFLKISYLNIYIENKLSLVFLIHNTSNDIVTDLQIDFSDSDSVSISGVAWEESVIKKSPKNQIQISELGPHVTVTVSFDVKITKLNLGMNFDTKITYNARKQQKNFNFDFGIFVNDIVRPLNLVTQQFGQQWESLRQEKRLRIDNSVIQDANSFMNFIQNDLNGKPVEIINTEAISCCQTTDQKFVALIHARLQIGKPVEIIIRSKDMMFSEILSRFISKKLTRN